MAEVYQPEGFFVTTLSQDLNASDTTVNLTAVPSVTKGYIVIEPSSSTKREVIHFTSVGASTVTTSDDTTDASDASGRGCTGSITTGANTTHSQGATVLIAATAQYWDRLFDALATIINTSTGVPDLNGNELILDADADSSLTADTDDVVDLKLGGSDSYKWSGTDYSLPSGGNIQVANADPKRGIYVPSAGMYAATTKGAASGQIETSTNKNNYKSFDFDTAQTEYVQFSIPSPIYWDAGSVSANFYWTASTSSTASPTVKWAMQGVSLSNDDAMDVAYGTAQSVSDTFLLTNDMHVSGTTSNITISGTPVAGDYINFRIARYVHNDNLAVDAKLLGVRIKFGIKQYSDA